MRTLINYYYYTARPYSWEQAFFNELIMAFLWGMGDDPPLRFRILPQSSYANIGATVLQAGDTASVRAPRPNLCAGVLKQRMDRKLLVDPVIIHGGATMRKVRRCRPILCATGRGCNWEYGGCATMHASTCCTMLVQAEAFHSLSLWNESDFVYNASSRGLAACASVHKVAAVELEEGNAGRQQGVPSLGDIVKLQTLINVTIAEAKALQGRLSVMARDVHLLALVLSAQLVLMLICIVSVALSRGKSMRQ